ncbi:hypothetical protein [Clostridium manihotivorum]|uniref:Uncharacterized protein n=1 Tax=Clostridium manihotivorum TaxID=2320868 RepID=A0A410DQK2_9CLOT|nr:hypothetical protein [Clostridium manihotivorum]QAA31316.1 hypothetical protein C1I91_06485 [Clostridium manihotivorum]
MKDNIELITKILEFGLAITSVIGAFISWTNSKKTKKDVDYIEKVKKEILNRESIEQIGIVREAAAKIKEIMKSYFLRSNRINVTGRNFKKDITQIKEALTIIKENRDIFQNSEANCSDIIYSEVNVLVEQMTEFENDEDNLKRSMRETDNKMDNFLANLKELKNS